MKLLQLLRDTMLAIVTALLIAAVASFGVAPAFATTLTITPQRSIANRSFNTQQTHYIRFVFNYNQCPLRAGGTACSMRVKVVAVPSTTRGSWYRSQSRSRSLTFNPTTSATVALGVSGQDTTIMAAFNVFTGQATTAVYDTSFAGAGELVTGSGATQTGMNGGFDVYATYTVGAAGSQGTQGQVVFIIQYIAANDGSCVTVPLNSTSAVAC